MQDSAGVSGGLREAKKRATRRQLTAAARRLTLTHGLDGITVEMVCAEVGVSVRTFFNYFATRDDALVGDDLPMGDDEAHRRFVEGGPTGVLLPDLLSLVDPGDALREAGRDEFRTGFAVMMQEPRILARQLAHGMEHEQRLAGLVAARRGLTEPDALSLTTAALALTLLRRAVGQWVEADDDSDLGPHLQACLAAATSALHPDRPVPDDLESP